MSSAGGESTRTVLIAFGVNFLVAIAKSTAALISGSASMVAESAYFWADTGNQISCGLPAAAAPDPPTRPLSREAPSLIPSREAPL